MNPNTSLRTCLVAVWLRIWFERFLVHPWRHQRDTPVFTTIPAVRPGVVSQPYPKLVLGEILISQCS